MTTPTVPYTQPCSISIESLQEAAARRDLALGQEQRRDSQGQFLSHKDLPESERRDR